MNNFNYHRFKNVVRWEVLANWTSLVRGTLGLAIGLSVYYIFRLFTTGNLDGYNAAGVSSYYLLDLCGLTTVVLGMAFAYMTINIFRKLKTKQYRISLFILPASNLEKYLSRFLVVAVGAVLMDVCALVMADVVQMVMSLVFKPALTGSLTLTLINPSILTEFFGAMTDQKTILVSCFIFSGMLLAHSVFTLGGTIFRRHAVVLTAVISFFAGMFLFSWLARIPWLITLDHFEEKYVELGIALYSLGQLVLALVFYGLSYWIFTRMQVISNKWLNI